MSPAVMHSSSKDSFVYYGDREGWHVALSVHRDSDVLDRSNWDVITADVLAIRDDAPAVDGLADAAIERMSHFLCGWVDHLLVRPGSTAAARARYWHDKLESYPVADEEHYSALETNEEWCERCDSATREQHPIARCGKFRGEYETEEIHRRWDARS